MLLMIVLLVYANQTSRKEKFNIQNAIEKSKTECVEKCMAACQSNSDCLKNCTSKCEQDTAQVKIKGTKDCLENHPDCQKLHSDGKCSGHTPVK
ncbi:hypothetical protein JW964_25535 [candidate division KSB1 bacterium]|nr:hypothetical protein [candidate division KSB1 bacterium]